MFRKLVEGLAALREKRSRSTNVAFSGRRARPAVEALEDRSLLATLLWIGSAGDAWSNMNKWANMADGQPKQPANGDSLIFDPAQSAPGNIPGTNTSSTMDMNGLKLDDLTLASGFTGTIIFNNNLTVDDDITINNGMLDGGAPPPKSSLLPTPPPVSAGAGGRSR